MSGFTRSTLVECPRSQSLEYNGNNSQNLSQWTNRCGDGIHLKAGDQISVHSSYISEIGAEAGQIQISGKSLGASVDVSITQYSKKLFQDNLPQKYTLVDVENASQSVDIRDDTLNVVVSPYKCANGEYYAHLPRRFIGKGTTIMWNQENPRDGGPPVSGSDAGQTWNPPYPLARCSSDINIKYLPYSTTTADTRYRVDGINDGARYTIFARKQTFFGSPNTPSYVVTGHARVGSPDIQLTHSSTTDNLIVGMTLITQSPSAFFPVNSSIVSIDDGTGTLTMSNNATLNSNSNATFTFQVSASLTEEYLPPDAGPEYSTDVAESLRDPALWGDYIQVKNLISVKANPGYNSPTDLADQLTQELNDRTDIQRWDYDTTSTAGTYTKRETFTISTETPSNRLYNCATATDYSENDYNEWRKTDGTRDINHSYHYLSSYQHIGIKRPELYTQGIKLVPPGDEGPWYDGRQGGRNGYFLSPDYPMSSFNEVFNTNVEWNEENLLRFKSFFDAQAIYPELFDYTQSGFQCSPNFTRFIHLNLYDIQNGSYTDQGGDTWSINFGTSIRSPKAPPLGYDLYDENVSASNTTYPLFVDYNPATATLKSTDVSSTDYGNTYFAFGATSNYDDLAYGFGRKVRLYNRGDGTYKDVIGFQFTRTGNQIPTHFFQFNASAAINGTPNYQLGSGRGRAFGFDFHFSAYGNSAMILYNGNSNNQGASYASLLASILYSKTYRFAQARGDKIYNLDPYQFAMYIGADEPQITYDTDQQRFRISSLHTSEKIGDPFDGGINRAAGSSAPISADATEGCYKVNKRPLRNSYTPELAPYTDQFSAAFTGASATTYVSHNIGIHPWSIMDAQCGLFIEDWIVPEDLWDTSLVGIMGFRYNQFHNPNTTSSRQVRLKAHGANADLNNVNVITTNAEIADADLVDYQQNATGAKLISPVLPVGIEPRGPGFSIPGRYVTPAVTVSPAESVYITAERLPSKSLRPYYTIRSDIIADSNQVLGGLTSGITLPIVAVVNKANPYGDFLNGFAGEIQFTNTIDRVITKIRCSIHEPNGEAARCDPDSAVIFKIDQKVNADLDLVGTLLQDKKKQVQEQVDSAIDPELDFNNVKYVAKDLFQ